MAFDLSPTSALDLTLRGSTGSFKVGAKSNTSSLEVKYFLTHVGLNFESGSDEKLLRQLAPVREIFDFKSLDFDEIMQRDIDDARVSAELVPYLLDDKTKGLIKFFPPIVVMVLPIEAGASTPAPFYSKVIEETVSEKKSGVDDWKMTRSGEIGAEVFQFEQPILSGGEPQSHDLVSFSLNTSKSRLVIVDGQHRAMALLALYRNLKDEWSDARRKPFESYYAEWTPEYIRQFDLQDIHLPMILCTVPSLDASYSGDYDLKKACRSIFLTLNKNARKVSRSRNLLLDDNDLISSFMRKTLSAIKNEHTTIRADNSLEIHCVELDQSGDKLKITSPVAITGVSHFYYMIEHLMLNDENVDGVSPRSGRFASRTYFQGALERLDVLDDLGHDAFNSIRRDFFNSKEEKLLSEKFYSEYGSKIVQMLSKLSVFDSHNRATIKLKEDLGKNSDVHLRPMLFDGQGMARIFESHREKLGDRLSENFFDTDVPKIRELKSSLDATDLRVKEAVSNFKDWRIRNYLAGINKSSIYVEERVDNTIFKICDNWFENIFSSIAFQSAIVCGFYYIVEKTQITGGEIDEAYSEYIEQLGAFLKPSSFSKLKNLIGLFEGRVEGEDCKSLSIMNNTPDTFRYVVYPGEMQPDQWPKYMYLMLEIWTPKQSVLKQTLDTELEKARVSIFSSLYHRERKEYLAKNMISEENISKENVSEIFSMSFGYYRDMLRYLSKASVLNESGMRTSLN